MSSDLPRGHAESVQAGHPLMPYCHSCERAHFYPRNICPHCGSKDLELKRPGAFMIRSFSWVMRPQSTAFEGRVPILIMVGNWSGANLIAEGDGWSPDCPPKIGHEAQLMSGARGNGTYVAVFGPLEGN